ncbi:hypothetical protein LCGC14_1785720, partial [marine sediment metagenome]
SPDYSVPVVLSPYDVAGCSTQIVFGFLPARGTSLRMLTPGGRDGRVGGMIAFAKPPIPAARVSCTVPAPCPCCCDAPEPVDFTVTISAGPPPGGCSVREIAEIAMGAAIEVMRRRGMP